MQPFSYTYQGQTLEALVEHFTQDLYNRYKITFDGETIVITPGAIRALGEKTIWVQTEGPVKPEYLIHAIGEGLVLLGITTVFSSKIED